jgi:hypothetical protein
LYVATLKQQFAYGIYISQLIGYSSACGSGFRYLDVLDGELLLLNRQTTQWLKEKVKTDKQRYNYTEN